ncbi:IS66 family transposase zinc-finger binding domain-containing protein [Arcticibacter svalbardensis]|uniref:IS66 family transposase zinc-finger binding domain-containing protein n=1 Tax=Arcticibacter svalbardensis TaxID=1288027 RepID=UPI001267FACA|nr:IS66 family transposase zinc-finger binding domain-containing protein [Arcticibacter svalbardensis]
MAFRTIPDEIKIHTPEYCHCCGDDLSAIAAIPLSKRQVIDIPQPVAICTEHRTFSKTCSCGHTTKSSAGS